MNIFLKTIFMHDILLEEHHHRNCHITFLGSLFACSISSSCFDLNFHVFVKTYTETIVVCIILRYFVIDKSNVMIMGFLLSCRFNWWIFTWLQIFSFTLICFKFLYRYGGMVANRTMEEKDVEIEIWWNVFSIHFRDCSTLKRRTQSSLKVSFFPCFLTSIICISGSNLDKFFAGSLISCGKVIRWPDDAIPPRLSMWTLIHGKILHVRCCSIIARAHNFHLSPFSCLVSSQIVQHLKEYAICWKFKSSFKIHSFIKM